MKNLNLVICLMVTLICAQALAVDVTLICKKILTHPARTPDVNFNDARRININYQKVTVTTPTGSQVIYAPVNMQLTKKFYATNRPAGARGENLTDGQCGLAAAIIKGIDLSTSSANPTITFANFSQYGMGATEVNMLAQNRPVLVLPPCTSGIYQIIAAQFSPNEYYVGDESRVTCIP